MIGPLPPVNFTCHFIILNCRKWPISAFRGAPVVVFVCDRDRVIVDCELQGPETILLKWTIHSVSFNNTFSNSFALAGIQALILS